MRGCGLVAAGVLLLGVAAACAEGDTSTKTPGTLTVAAADPGGAGFENDLMETLASRLDLTLQWVEADPATILTRLADGEFDIAIPVGPITTGSEVTFTDPYLNALQAFVVNTRVNRLIGGYEDLRPGDRVGVVTGSKGAGWAGEHLPSEGAVVIEFADAAAAYDAAVAGQVVGVIVDEPGAYAEIMGRTELELVQAIDTGERYGFALDPVRNALDERIGGVLREMHEDGTYQAIYDAWFDTPGGSVLYQPGSGGRPLRFTAAEPPVGRVGVDYFFDFCGPMAVPETQRLSLLPCDPGPGKTPSGGHPPYHFQLGSGSGFPPIELHLQKDGVINGPPKTTTPGTSFEVCVVDLAGDQVCREVIIIIEANVVTLAFQGTWQVDALSAVCPAGTGSWEATLTVADGRLTGIWTDTFHGTAEFVIDVPMDQDTATWVADEGEWSITLTGTFDLEAGTVAGTLIGPLCTQAAGRWTGTFQGAGTHLDRNGTETSTSIFELTAGDCFQDDPAAGDVVAAVATIGCEQPHDNEVYFEFQLAGTTFAGSDVLQANAFERCASEFLGFVGIPYEFSELEIFPITPTAESWSAGDRTVLCALYHMDLDKLTGSMRDANR